MKAFARASLGETDAGNLRGEATSEGRKEAPGRDESGAPGAHGGAGLETEEV